MKRILLIALIALLAAPVSKVAAQSVLDGAYIKEHTRTRKVVPYPYIRQADVLWGKRIWQIIDLRQKMNLPLYYPIDEISDRKNLFDVMKQGLLVDGSLTAYSTGPLGNDDEFNIPLLASEIESMMSTIDTTYTTDVDTGEMIEVIQQLDIESQSVKQYKIKEDWYFDRQRSERYVRIIGIAPRIEITGDDGEVRGMRDLFWLYFPECRYVFANWDIFNRHNDSERLSYEDFFWKRLFTSYIVKETNVYDRNIAEYTSGIDHLLEAERIKEEIFEFEHDLWSY